jgi:hypothetical protein
MEFRLEIAKRTAVPLLQEDRVDYEPGLEPYLRASGPV